jgi:hypothetical protein
MSGHLAPFALQAAFPPSLVRRDSHDYYGACVALELAPLSTPAVDRDVHGLRACRW